MFVFVYGYSVCTSPYTYIYICMICSVVYTCVYTDVVDIPYSGPKHTHSFLFTFLKKTNWYENFSFRVFFLLWRIKFSKNIVINPDLYCSIIDYKLQCACLMLFHITKWYTHRHTQCGAVSEMKCAKGEKCGDWRQLFCFYFVVLCRRLRLVCRRQNVDFFLLQLLCFFFLWQKKAKNSNENNKCV